MARNSIIGWIVKKLKGNMALVEDSTTASQNISANKYVVFQGVLCTADSAISQGDTLATSGAGKNLTEVTGGGFNELNDHIANLKKVIVYDIGTVTTDSGGTIVLANYTEPWKYAVITALQTAGGSNPYIFLPAGSVNNVNIIKTYGRNDMQLVANTQITNLKIILVEL